MARGRFLSKEISVDKKVNDLKNPWSMLAFTWLLAHADAEGRTYGDPAIVKSIVFPRQGDCVSTKDMEGFIQDWHNAGLVVWYEFDGDRFIEFPNFDKHQAGLRKDREPKSIIPAMNDNVFQQNDGNVPDVFQQNDGSLQAEVEVKLSRNEVEVEHHVPASSPAFSSFQTSDGWYIRVFNAVTGMSSIPGQLDKVIPALDGLMARFKTESEVIKYITPYWKYWLTKKRKDGAPVSKANCAWLTEMAVAGDPLPGDKKTNERPDPKCLKCNGMGVYSSGEKDIHSPKFGTLVKCDCVKVIEEVEA